MYKYVYIHIFILIRTYTYIGSLIASIGQPFEKYEEMVVNHSINGEILMTLIDDEKALTGVYMYIKM
jgi:hypothetical protein